MQSYRKIFVIKYRQSIILLIHAAVWKIYYRGTVSDVCEVALLSHHYSWLEDLTYKLNAPVGVFSVCITRLVRGMFKKPRWGISEVYFAGSHCVQFLLKFSYLRVTCINILKVGRILFRWDTILKVLAKGRVLTTSVCEKRGKSFPAEWLGRI